MTPAMSDLLDTVRALYPGADVRLAGRGGTGAADPADRCFRVVVSAHRPKLLVPDDAPAAASTAMRRTSARDSRRRQRARSAVATLTGSPLRRWVFGPAITVRRTGSDIERYLTRALDAEPGDLRLAVSIGASRANRKPVLDVLHRDGRRLAFVKVGTSALANRLVAAEADALRLPAVRGLTHCDAPVVEHEGIWNDHRVLALSPLPGGPARDALGGGPLPRAAMRELCAAHGITTSRLDGSGWLAEVIAAAQRLGTPLGRRLRHAVLAFTAAHGGTWLGFGAWHGDWGPWNMSWVQGRPQVWDWERFGREVPIGFDAIHFVSHRVLRQRGRYDLAEDVLDGPAVTAAAALTGADDPDVIRATVDAYLLEIARRYSMDAAEPSGAAVAPAAAWFLDLVLARCTVPTITRART